MDFSDDPDFAPTPNLPNWNEDTPAVSQDASQAAEVVAAADAAGASDAADAAVDEVDAVDAVVDVADVPREVNGATFSDALNGEVDALIAAVEDYATAEDIERLQLRSAYKLRTYAVGSVLPMCCNRLSTTRIRTGLSTILNQAAPDPKVLAVLRYEGFALRAVSWRTSSCLRIHNGIMRLAGVDTSVAGSALVATVDPSLDCLRSARFIALIRSALEVEYITDVERSALVGATLSLVLKTPPHPRIALGEWEERLVDMVAETKHLDGARIMLIPEPDKDALKEKINNTLLLASITEETDLEKTAELSSTLKLNKKGWVDDQDRDRALKLIKESVVLLVGQRHVAADRDNLLMDPITCDVSCMHDVSRRNAVLRGPIPRSLDVPLDMFSLHTGVVMAAAIRVVAKYSKQDRDAMMEEMSSEASLFEQPTYLAKTYKRSLKEHAEGKEEDSEVDPAAKIACKSTRRRLEVELDNRFTLISDAVDALRAEYETRIKSLETTCDRLSHRRSQRVDSVEDI